MTESGDERARHDDLQKRKWKSWAVTLSTEAMTTATSDVVRITENILQCKTKEGRRGGKGSM